jgi:hypothetical protein
MNTTQLTVNPENLVKNLRFSFTQATTVLGELNAKFPPRRRDVSQLQLCRSHPATDGS